ncbi:MAG: FeoB-associated Cys-rich membrane protein [Clostridia bacterium]|nr:FeoB-associated Cys-rich membrane protein [Clostridia bacterium]
MNVWDYILIAVIVLAAAGSAAFILIRKKRRGSCCTGCSECMYSGTCNAASDFKGSPGCSSGKSVKKQRE